jgi:hypothetical protein
MIKPGGSRPLVIEARSMSSGLVEVYKFTLGGLRPGPIPARHTRLCAHRHLKPHNFLVPLPDDLAATGSKTRSVSASRRVRAARLRRSIHAGSSNDPVRFSNSTLMLQISIVSSPSRIASPAHASPQPAALTCATVQAIARCSSAARCSQSRVLIPNVGEAMSIHHVAT